MFVRPRTLSLGFPSFVITSLNNEIEGPLDVFGLTGDGDAQTGVEGVVKHEVRVGALDNAHQS